MMLAITKAQSGIGFAYHHRSVRDAMVKSKNPCRRENETKRRRKKIKKSLDVGKKPC